MDFTDKYLKNNKHLLLYKSSGREDSVILARSGIEIVFPIENSYLMNQLLPGFGADGKDYDFTAYDRSLDSTWLDPRRVEMILMRLKYPVDMTEERQNVLRKRIIDQLPKILERIAKADDMRVLRLLCEQSIFTKENVGSCVEILGSAGAREMMAELMNWKNRTFGSSEFDFTL